MPDPQMLTIGECCSVLKGKVGIKKAVPGEYPLVTTAEERSSHMEYHFDQPSVIIPLVSSTGHGHASLKRIHYQEGKFAVGSILCAVTPKREQEIHAKFLYHYLDINKEDLLVSQMKGMANVTLSVDKIKSIKIPLLPFEKQLALIQVVENSGPRINNLKDESIHQQTLLKKLRQSILHDAISGKLTELWRKENPDIEPASELLKRIKTEKDRLVKEKKIKKQNPLPPITEDEIPFELPKGWVWCRLGELGICQTGTTPTTSDKTNFGDFIPFIKPGDISPHGIDYNNEGLSQKGLSEGRIIPKGSILMVCIGGSIGKTFYNVKDVSCNQQINTIVPLFDIQPFFLHKVLLSPYFQDTVWRKKTGGTMPIINRAKWERIPLPLPPRTEQNYINERVNNIFIFCDQLEAQTSKNQQDSERLMQAVLKEAFNNSLIIIRNAPL